MERCEETAIGGIRFRCGQWDIYRLKLKNTNLNFLKRSVFQPLTIPHVGMVRTALFTHMSAHTHQGLMSVTQAERIRTSKVRPEESYN